jgi:hypothetical protein
MSGDNGQHFTGYERISYMGSHPQITALADDRLAIVWDESVQAGDKYYKRIGVQLRSSKGVNEDRRFITGDTSMATYPVVSPSGDNSLFIAYTMKKGKDSYIIGQRVLLK